MTDTGVPAGGAATVSPSTASVAGWVMTPDTVGRLRHRYGRQDQRRDAHEEVAHFTAPAAKWTKPSPTECARPCWPRKWSR